MRGARVRALAGTITNGLRETAADLAHVIALGVAKEIARAVAEGAVHGQVDALRVEWAVLDDRSLGVQISTPSLEPWQPRDAARVEGDGDEQPGTTRWGALQ